MKGVPFLFFKETNTYLELGFNINASHKLYLVVIIILTKGGQVKEWSTILVYFFVGGVGGWVISSK